MKRHLLVLTLLSTILFAVSSKLDDKTSLIWQDNREIPKELSFVEAQKYCQELTLDGFNNWHLPSIKELATIIDFDYYRPALKSGFQMRYEERFWSTTTDAANPKNAWIVSFGYGEIESYPKSREYRVRCVAQSKSKKK